VTIFYNVFIYQKDFPRILKIFLAIILFIQELDPFFFLESSKNSFS
jgi:hypothetical protein